MRNYFRRVIETQNVFLKKKNFFKDIIGFSAYSVKRQR